MLQPFKHMIWVFLAKKTAPSNSLVQRFLWKNRKSGIFEALFQQDNDIVKMRDMAHLICLIKLYQITIRKKFQFFVSDYLNDEGYCIYKISCLNLITNVLNLSSMYTFFGQQYTVVSTYTDIILLKMWDSAARSTSKISLKGQTVEGKTNG